MKSRAIALILALLALSAALLSGAAVAQDAPDMLFFYRETCDECHLVRNEILPGFLAKWGSRIHLVSLELSQPGMLDSLYALESRAGMPEAEKHYPAIYFMGTMLEGPESIALDLDHLAAGYFANPDSSQAFNREVLARIPEKLDAAAEPDRTVHIAYFYKLGCADCTRAFEITEWVQNLYSNVRVDTFDIALEKNKLIATALGTRAGVPENRLMSTPMILIGDDFLLSEQITRANLLQLIAEYRATGAEPAWETLTETELASSESFIAREFESFTLFAVLLAGLGDGINPCAFATILFLVSYLGMLGRKRTEILAVGLTFAFAVFITYFLVGLGFFRFVQSLSNLSAAADIIFGGTAALCFVFGALSIYDYFKARAGNTAGMALQLPKFLKLRIHQTIREKTRMHSIVMGAFLAGVLISLLELACTGQIYLPTIVFMVGAEGYSARAVLYLLLYNLCFVIPLLIVFAVVYFGVSSKSIARLMETNVGSVKLVLTAVFFTVGALLVWTVLH